MSRYKYGTHEFSGEFKTLQVRWDNEDGTHYREVYYPGRNITELPQSIQDEANAMWTQDVIDAYQAAQQQAV